MTATAAEPIRPVSAAAPVRPAVAVTEPAPAQASSAAPAPAAEQARPAKPDFSLPNYTLQYSIKDSDVIVKVLDEQGKLVRSVPGGYDLAARLRSEIDPGVDVRV